MLEIITVQCCVRNLFRQKARNTMTLASIIFGVVGLILSGGFVEDIFIQLREATIHSRLGHFQVYREGFYANGSHEPYNYLIDDPNAIKERVAAVPGVLDSMLRVNFFALLNNGKTDLPIIGEGGEPEKEARLGSHLFLIAGRQLENGDSHGIFIGEGVAKSLGLTTGSVVTVLANTPEGALNSLDFTVVGVFRTYSKEFDDRAVRIALPAAQDLLRAPGAHAVVVSLREGADTDAIAGKVKRSLAGKGFEVKTWLELDDFYAKTVDLYKSQLGILQLIILIVVLLSVANSVNMTAYERIGEFGTLKALGNREWQIFLLVVLENAILGFLGAMLGVVVGITIAMVLTAIGIPMPPPPNSNVGYTAYIRIVPGILFVSFAIGLAATVLSSLLPARAVARIPVADALRWNV